MALLHSIQIIMEKEVEIYDTQQRPEETGSVIIPGPAQKQLQTLSLWHVRKLERCRCTCIVLRSPFEIIVHVLRI